MLYSGLAALGGARTARPTMDEAAAPIPATTSKSTPQNHRPPWLVAVGLVALLSLLFQVVLPLWLIWEGIAAYDARLPTYYFWLGFASVVHLGAITMWVLRVERRQGPVVR